jgi:hypothetical protein
LSTTGFNRPAKEGEENTVTKKLALLAAAAFLTELIIVPNDETSFDLRDTTSFTFSASIHIAAVLLLGVWAAAVVAAFGVVAADGLQRRAVRHIVFNASAEALAAAAAGEPDGGPTLGTLFGR